MALSSSRDTTHLMSAASSPLFRKACGAEYNALLLLHGIVEIEMLSLYHIKAIPCHTMTSSSKTRFHKVLMLWRNKFKCHDAHVKQGNLFNFPFSQSSMMNFMKKKMFLFGRKLPYGCQTINHDQSHTE